MNVNTAIGLGKLISGSFNLSLGHLNTAKGASICDISYSINMHCNHNIPP